MICQEYIQYHDYWVGHFAVWQGQIQLAIYYQAYNTDKKFIKRQSIQNYTRNDTNQYQFVFEQIFDRLNYSGFACSDFCTDLATHDLKIFEINPRFGGSLLQHSNDFQEILLAYVKAQHSSQNQRSDSTCK